MTAMVSTSVMIRRIAGLLGTRDLSAWEQGFIQSLVEKLETGEVTGLSERQVETLERLHERHFA